MVLIARSTCNVLLTAAAAMTVNVLLEIESESAVKRGNFCMCVERKPYRDFSE